jgi:flagellar basal body L-ring protein FlgH
MENLMLKRFRLQQRSAAKVSQVDQQGTLLIAGQRSLLVDY